MGKSWSLASREAGERERLWVCNPGHPIAAGIDRFIEVENTEIYGEPFAIPDPDLLFDRSYGTRRTGRRLAVSLGSIAAQTSVAEGFK